MAKDEGYSVDEMLKGYAKKKRERNEETYGTSEERKGRYENPSPRADEREHHEPRPRKQEEEEYYERRPSRQPRSDEEHYEPRPRKQEEEEYYERRHSRRAARDEDDEYYERRPHRLGDSGEDEEGMRKPMVRNRPLILFTYALRSLAVSLMLMLMLFIILHDVMKKQPVISYFSVVGDSFSAFLSAYSEAFILAFAIAFVPQLAYYIVYRMAKGKWRTHTREELVYSILFATVGIAGSFAIIWMLGI